MPDRNFRNASFATVAGLADALSHGVTMRVRDREVRELRNRFVVLGKPLERCVILPHRNNDVFATIAETIWMLAGRDDIVWLTHYLHRAGEFSDDGLRWRGAYGPRLREWNDTDQIDAVRRLLIADPMTRRAVMSIFDPARDFAESKDIPCNNWLHWMIRDGRLHLTVGVRSNDIVWGFSGINTFEWSVLHEAMAFWVGATVGEATYLAGSFHLYERHYAAAPKMVGAFNGTVCYDFGLPNPAFSTTWADFDAGIRDWFVAEARLRDAPERPVDPSWARRDPFLDCTLRMLRLCNGAKAGWDDATIRDELAALPSCDFAAAAYEFFSRSRPTLLENIAQPGIARFFAALNGGRARGALGMREEIKQLHRAKDAAYGNSWKKRGEAVSILCNIARKADRLAQAQVTMASIQHESIRDTVIDLFVYLTKYRLFLLDQVTVASRAPFGPDSPAPLSDHTSNFDVLVDAEPFAAPTEAVAVCVRQVLSQCDGLSMAVERGVDPGTKLSLVVVAAREVAGLIAVLAQDGANATV